MKYKYPLQAIATKTYSHRISDYKELSDIEKSILVNNFREFYKYCFWWLNLPHPTRDQLFMAQWCARTEKDNSKKPNMLQAQRGLAKSLTLQLFILWLLLRNPDEKIVIVSATSKRSKSFVGYILKLFMIIPLVKHLAPNGDDRSSTEKFDVACRIPDDSPSLQAFGVTSVKTGSRATRIIYDDAEVPENSGTPDKREKLLEGVRDTANLGVAGVFTETCICTPQSGDTIYETLIDEDGFRCTIIPSEYPEKLEPYNNRLAKHLIWLLNRDSGLIGLATDKRNNMEHLIKQKIKGKLRYKLQYMLDPSMSDEEKYPLKLEDLIVYELEKDKAPVNIIYGSEKELIQWKLRHNGFAGNKLYAPRRVSKDVVKYRAKAMFIDPAGRGKDLVGYAIVGIYGSKYYILDFGGLAGGYSFENLETLGTLAKEFEVNKIVLENNFGDGIFTKLFQSTLINDIKYRCEIEEVRATTNKNARIIDTLEPLLMQHRLVINKSSLSRDCEIKQAKHSFTFQLSHITNDSKSLAHDDVLDAVEGAISIFKEEALRNEAKDEASYKKRIAEQISIDYLKSLKSKHNIQKSTVRNICDNY